MAEAIRKLQLFRNDALLTGSAYEVRGLVDSAYQGGSLLLNDGEPISVRYQEEQNGEIKGLYGIAYDDGNGHKCILWGGSGDSVTIDTFDKTGEYVTLNYDFNEETNHYDLIVEANVMMLDDACGRAYIVTSISERVKELYWRSEPEEGSENPTYTEVQVGDMVRLGSDYDGFFTFDGEEYQPATSRTDYTVESATWTGLADACDVKSHIKYYDVVPGDNIVTISSTTGTDVNGFSTTTYTVSISTENLPSAPEYTITKISTTENDILAVYALFKDGVQQGDAINIPKDFLVKSGQIIEVVEHDGNYYDSTDTGYEHALPVNAAGSYLDLVINVKTGGDVPNDHVYIPTNKLVDAYTAGTAITISTSNVVGVKVSSDNGNQISVSGTDGGLFVPAGETITDVSMITADCGGQAAETPIYYGYVNGEYVVITKTSSNPDTYEYNGQPYTGAVGGPVACGHRYLVVQTSGGNMYFAKNDASADIHVTNFSIATNTNNDDVLRITMNDGGPYDVLISSIVPDLDEATVNWNIGSDSLSIGTAGVLTNLALGTIEAYIDNFDCGTFTIATQQE